MIGGAMSFVGAMHFWRRHKGWRRAKALGLVDGLTDRYHKGIPIGWSDVKSISLDTVDPASVRITVRGRDHLVGGFPVVDLACNVTNPELLERTIIDWWQAAQGERPSVRDERGSIR